MPEVNSFRCTVIVTVHWSVQREGDMKFLRIIRVNCAQRRVRCDGVAGTKIGLPEISLPMPFGLSRINVVSNWSWLSWIFTSASVTELSPRMIDRISLVGQRQCQSPVKRSRRAATGRHNKTSARKCCKRSTARTRQERACAQDMKSSFQSDATCLRDSDRCVSRRRPSSD